MLIKLSFFCAASFQLQISLGGSDKDICHQDGNHEWKWTKTEEARKRDEEESVLAMLGLLGPFWNLIVIIFVYIYTTL